MPMAIAPTISTTVMPSASVSATSGGRGALLHDLEAADDSAKGIGAGHHRDHARKGEGGGGRMKEPGEHLCQKPRHQRADRACRR